MRKITKSKNQIKIHLIILSIMLFLIVVGFAAYGTYVYNFDHTLQTYHAGDENEYLSISIAPRTGQTDCWVKAVETANETIDYYGIIYDITLANIGNCDITNWDFRIDIPEDGYINNAWCGTVEIHQNVGKKESVQTLDLRNYEKDSITLDYQILDPDLLIPIYKGDYIIYHPDAQVKEYPVYSNEHGSPPLVVTGIIFYQTDSEPITYNNYSLEYYLHKGFIKSWVFYVLLVSCIVWLLLVIIFTCVELNLKQARIRFNQDERIIRQSIGVFTQFFEAKDTYTNGHSQRVAQYSEMIAHKLGWSDEQCRQIYYIALMHDCGKCYIPDEILKKPGKLTTEEYEIIKSHTVKGAEMLENFTAIDSIREGVLYHHERFDGTGYPQGLKGNDIPLISRIICISDSFDAMNSKRCYRDFLSDEYILSELKKNSGKQFDPKLVEIFLSLIEEGSIVLHKDE